MAAAPPGGIRYSYYEPQHVDYNAHGYKDP